ncbi:MAG: hypothetical protein A2017_18060 [Lentisphaerae bacterium GWF2_44_16]|nr:MAG: hypothetical protein A2017_18060 [Lentisphaerae bacterium GWF2_44_16]
MENLFATEIIGMLQVNCYIVNVPESGNLYIIDPGSEAEKIISRAKTFKYKEAAVLLTHAHVDHISATGEVMKGLGIEKLYLHPDDIGLYRSPDNNLMPFIPAAKDLPEPMKEFKSEDFQIVATPGHTRGGVCYLFNHIPALFSGDTLFCDSIGRADLPGGNLNTLMKSIKETLFNLPDTLPVYPGHGPATTIGSEKKGNPFIE